MSILLNTQGWQGDYVNGSTVHILFSTSSPAAGQASPLVAGVVAVYKGTTTSNSGAGITLTAQTSGINYVAVNTAADTNFFQTGNDYTVILQSGTVSGFGVSGIVIGSFSLINRSDNLIITQNGTASAGGANSVTLQANASSAPNFYNNQTVVLTQGTGAGQSAVIQSYASGTHIATITGTWATAPASGTGYVVYGGGINTANVQQINNSATVTSSAQIGVNLVTINGASAVTSSAQLGVNVNTWNGGRLFGVTSPDVIITSAGTAQAGGANAITLQTGTGFSVKGQIVVLTNGTGAGESAIINSYNTTSNVAGLNDNLSISPASGTGYATIAFGTAFTNLTLWEGVAPNSLVNGLVATSVSGGSIASVTAIVSGVNVTQWMGNPPNPLVAGLVQASASGGSISSVASITSGVNVTQWQGSPPNVLVSGLVAASASGGSIGTIANITSGVNVTQWQGSPPNVLVSGLVSASVSGGSVGSVVSVGAVASVTSGVNVTQWLGATTNPLISGLVPTSVSGGSISSVAAITSGVNVTQWQGSPPAPLVQSLVQTQVSGTPSVIISPATFPPNFTSLAITSGTGLVTVGTNQDKTGYSLTSGEETNIANAVWDQASGIETNVTPRQALRYTAAANVGVTSGALTTTFTVSAMSAAGTTRITATTDSSGNRSAVVLT